MAKKLDKMVTNSLRQLAAENTEIDNDGNLVSRAHRLALIIWQLALGTGQNTVDGKTGKIVRCKPDKEMIKLCVERLDGRVLSTEEIDKSEESIPDKISRVGRGKINKISGEIKDGQ